MDIGTNFIIISKSWPELKFLVNRDFLSLRSEIENNECHIFAIDNPIIYLCTLYIGNVPHAIPISQEDNDGYLYDYNHNYSSTANSVITKRSEYGIIISESSLRSGNKTQIISQNFCDKNTWYSTSERNTDVVMTDTGDGLIWNLPDGYAALVDVMHGKILHERRLRNQYAPKLYVDGYVKIEKDPHDNVGDWFLDYSTGQVTFDISQSGKIVTFDYSKVINSKWYLTPANGKVLRLVSAELQFSTDTRLSDTFVFQPRADVAKFPPLAPYCTTNGGPFPPGTKLPIGDATYYQTVFDLICESNLAYPRIPKWDGQGATWRDLKSDMLVFSWSYGDQASIDIKSEWGMDIEVKLEHDTECQGTAAVVTFYCISEDTYT